MLVGGASSTRPWDRSCSGGVVVPAVSGGCGEMAVALGYLPASCGGAGLTLEGHLLEWENWVGSFAGECRVAEHC